MEPNIIDLLATDAPASEVSDAIKASLFAKSVEKIDALRPAVANSLLSQRYAMDFSRATKRYVALGTAADVAEKLSEFYSSGVRHFEFDFLGTPEERLHQAKISSDGVRPLLDFPCKS